MSGPSFAIIIPARFGSSRFPGKPLAPLAGATGIEKPLIQRSWECASQVPGCVGVWVATDDERIAEAAAGFGAQVVMTSADHQNGTERCAEAAAIVASDSDIIVNFQGDAPLSPPFVVGELVDALRRDPEALVSTPAMRCSRELFEHLMADRSVGRVGGTTIVIGQNDRAIYFSKEVLPFFPASAALASNPPVHLHLGIYAYRQSALQLYRGAPACELEQLEGLEQLRFLDLAIPIRVVRLEKLSWDPIELNNPSDTQAIERVLLRRGIS